MSDPGTVLVINSGSSSLKFGLYVEQGGQEAVRFKGSATHIGAEQGRLVVKDGAGKQVRALDVRHPSQEDALQEAVRHLKELGAEPPQAIGHRVVHGGPHLRQHQALTPEVMKALEEATHFAPLHIPSALRLIRATQRQLPDVPQFVCFDTAFHATLPEVASTFPLPRSVREQGVQRYGFHGLSYESIVARLAPHIPERTVVAHLGNGASLVALERGRSVDTSMGFTPTGGIPSGTRTGDLDPGVLLFLMRTGGLDADALETLVNKDSGLRGLSDGTSDMQALTRDAAAGNAAAALAVDVFTRGIAKTVGAYAAVLGGLDLLVFTGGIGENSAQVREGVCARLGHLGVRVDPQRNEANAQVITTDASPCPVRVLPSDEEVQLARHTRRLLRG
ncbi:acetate/propionate family kinase [Corallococcus sp. AB049A]|uniref:Acetate kinase n=1 Tax=Corallococcus interemptor TaxID=2316720 RepID=A0A3A8QH69_9BACT|nr:MULTISPECIES: acetate/propionate family kinase [Corallococcus]RKH67011.1 acetate/propionate family kinase [Corallococcus interemptor]RKI71696.1 acetate/propionate family kinase [Corallococcus sp. AB049A]